MKNFLLLLIAAIGLFSCKKDSSNPIVGGGTDPSTNYFPLEKGKQIEFQRKGIATYPSLNQDSLINFTEYPDSGSSINRIDTVIWKYEKDTTANDKFYAKILNKNIYNFSLVRKENGIYYMQKERYGLTPIDVIFLKENLKENDTWTNTYITTTYSGDVNENYKVLFTNKEITINGIKYQNVIAIRCEITIGTRPSQLTSITYYSKGIGEIYSYIEYPYTGRYEHDKFYRIK